MNIYKIKKCSNLTENVIFPANNKVFMLIKLISTCNAYIIILMSFFQLCLFDSRDQTDFQDEVANMNKELFLKY